MDIQRFYKNPFLAILRGITTEHLQPLLETILASGWDTLEIAMNTPNAPELIKEACRLMGDDLMIGAGTVLSPKQLHTALEAGASFIVMPTLVEENMQYCLKEGIPVFPGALTPQEIWNAWLAGATMVKVFPSKYFGPGYFRTIKEPLDPIDLLACGGVTPENLKDYYENGASAFAVGASVFRKEWLETGSYNSIGEALKSYINAYDVIPKRPARTLKLLHP